MSVGSAALRVLLVPALLAGIPAPVVAQVDPSPLIAPVVYHWAQAQNPFPTLEGGSVADASVPFWSRQVKLIEGAGFTAQLFQVSFGSEASQRSHLLALRDRHARGGPRPPVVAPFFAAESFVDYDVPKDVTSAAGFEAFYQAIRAFFTMYAEVLPAPTGQGGPFETDLLAWVDGRVFVTLWFVPLTTYDLPSDLFDRLNDRLEQDFGVRAYWSTHAAFADGNPDDINFLFNGSAPLQQGINTRHPSVDLLAAFWPPNLQQYRADLFAPRFGGVTYAAAWDALIALPAPPSIVLVESYNEITEASHLMPSWPINHTLNDGHWTGSPQDPRCMTEPCHPVEFVDGWGSTNPWHFLDLTRAKIREWLEGPPAAGADLEPPHALILAPQTGDRGSGLMPVEIVVADNQAVHQVRVYVDGRLALVTDGDVSERLKSQLLAPGEHDLFVEVEDTAGLIDTDDSRFIVAAAPLAATGAVATSAVQVTVRFARGRPRAPRR